MIAETSDRLLNNVILVTNDQVTRERNRLVFFLNSSSKSQTARNYLRRNCNDRRSLEKKERNREKE